MLCEASPITPHGAVAVLEKVPEGVDFVFALQWRHSAAQDSHVVQPSHIPTPWKLLHPVDLSHLFVVMMRTKDFKIYSNADSQILPIRCPWMTTALHSSCQFKQCIWSLSPSCGAGVMIQILLVPYRCVSGGLQMRCWCWTLPIEYKWKKAI